MPEPVSFRSAVRVWWRIGLLSFGGPAGQIALMHRLLVEERRWIDEARFLHALNYCMLLPGPEAQQLATYVGWLLHGVRGGLVAGTLFLVPGVAAMLALSWLYVLLGDVPAVEGLFLGLKAAVLAIVVQALLRIGKRTLHGRLHVALALAAFVALFVFGLAFPLVVAGAAATGYLVARLRPQAADAPLAALPRDAARTRRALLAASVLALAWAATLVLLPTALGDHVYTDIALFFSKAAVVTFGGAYAVLAYVAQQGVEYYGWLAPGEMLDGLGLAETTPGPLILVTQYVGFLAAYRHSGLEPVLVAATLGGLLTVWVTFLPCFVWIFAGAPFLEALRRRHALASALAAITAAVVGVIAHLALWFALNLLFSEHVRLVAGPLDLLLPRAASLQLPAVSFTVLALVLAFALRWPMLPMLGAMAACGMAWALAFG